MNNKMTKHESKTCPHCKNTFECKCGDIINCQCETVKLNQQQRDFILNKYDDCLCAECLAILRSEDNIETFNLRLEKLVLGR